MTILIIGWASKDLVSQNLAVPVSASDTVKKVAIYSKKSFFKNYPIDTLVYTLNLLNTNKNFTYYNIEDRSKTGLKADYVVDLNLRMSLPVQSTTKMETISTKTRVYVNVPLNDSTLRNERQYVYEQERTPVRVSAIPAEGSIRVKIMGTSKNEKAQRKTIVAASDKTEGLTVALIINLIEFIFEHFSN